MAVNLSLQLILICLCSHVHLYVTAYKYNREIQIKMKEMRNLLIVSKRNKRQHTEHCNAKLADFEFNVGD